MIDNCRLIQCTLSQLSSSMKCKTANVDRLINQLAVIVDEQNLQFSLGNKWLFATLSW